MHDSGDAVNDQDLELLESYLDDELTGRELEALRKRLSAEPQLVSAVDELRGQREMRQQFFAACAPDDASVQRLIQSVQRQATREVVWSERNRSLKWLSGLAACLVFGFVTGRGLRSNSYAPPPQSSDRVAQIGTPTQTVDYDYSNQRMRFDGPQIGFRPADNNAVDFDIRNRGLATVGANDPFPGDRIEIVDPYGRLVQRFSSHEQYMKFVQQKLGSSTQPAPLAP